MVNGTGGGPDGGPDGKAEARRTYRWVFRILSGFPNRDAFLYLKTARRPQVTFQEIPQHHNQEQIYHAGKTVWETCEISWYDMETPVDCSKSVYDWLRQTVCDIPTANMNHPRQYKAQAGLDVTDHTGARTEGWIMHNAWPSIVNWNELNYETNEILALNATIRYDRATKEV